MIGFKSLSTLSGLLIMSLNLSASPQAAPCAKTFPSDAQMAEQIGQMSNTEPRADWAVGGHFMVQENQRLIQSYRILTSYKDFFARPVSDIDYWSKFKDLGCSKALCGAETVFGKQDGLLYLYVADVYGFNLSSLGYNRLKPPQPSDELDFKAWYSFRPWKHEELKPYLTALAQLPKSLLPFPFVRMTHAGIVNPLNENILSNGLITIYSGLDSKSDFEKETSMYHEFGHNMFVGDENLDISSAWQKASGWYVKDGKVLNDHPEQFVDDYAKTNIYEDFAQTFMYYRYYPTILLEKSPVRYHYMKDVIYSGQEYLQCK